MCSVCLFSRCAAVWQLIQLHRLSDYAAAAAQPEAAQQPQHHLPLSAQRSSGTHTERCHTLTVMFYISFLMSVETGLAGIQTLLKFHSCWTARKISIAFFFSRVLPVSWCPCQLESARTKNAENFAHVTFKKIQWLCKMKHARLN